MTLGRDDIVYIKHLLGNHYLSAVSANQRKFFDPPCAKRQHLLEFFFSLSLGHSHGKIIDNVQII